jgi:hypothetical protein
VKQVLDGDRTSVRTLFLRAGDLQLFKGGNTLHRVTAPIGEDRHSLLLGSAHHRESTLRLSS